MNIQKLHFESPLGNISISTDGTFITEVCFCDNTGPGCLPENDTAFHPLLIRCKTELDGFFQGKLTKFTVPVRQAGTAFQQSVWNELLKIPFGKTFTYLELSKRIGDPNAIRAVGTSNGKNKIAIIVPCHRVIGSDGSLTGYAGGLSRKQWLLEHEMKIAHGMQTLF
jgi:methylated-DNA-[protein]-cysteine S-methyltransferase